MCQIARHTIGNYPPLPKHTQPNRWWGFCLELLTTINYIIYIMQTGSKPGCYKLDLIFHRIFHQFCHKTQEISLQVAPSFFPTSSSSMGSYSSSPIRIIGLMICYLTSLHVPLLIISNLGLSHEMCKEESSHPRPPWTSKCPYETMPLYFIHIYYLYDPN